MSIKWVDEAYMRNVEDCEHDIPVILLDDVKELIKIYSSIMLNPQKAFKEKYGSKLGQWFKDHEL